MFDLKNNLIKLDGTFKSMQNLMMRYKALDEQNIEIVNELYQDPEKSHIILSTLKIKENRNKDALYCGDGHYLYHSDQK